MNAETHLWLSVLASAFRDARVGDPEARAWLSRRSADLELVCNLAGIDPCWILRKAPELMGGAPGSAKECPSASPDAERVAAELLTRLAALRSCAA